MHSYLRHIFYHWVRYVGFLGKYSNRQTYIISPDSKIEYVFTDVEGKVATHADDVLTTVTKLQAS